MKIEYRKLIDSDAAPWQQLTNINELVWNGVYTMRVSDDDGTSHLPCSLANEDIVTIVVKDHAPNSMLQHGRTTMQEITKVERGTGSVFIYSRTCSNVNGMPVWTSWSCKENRVRWNSMSHIDTFTTAGTYHITGERINDSDGLPIDNAAPGHTFHARLQVLDSSISGTGESDDKCVTQVLSLSNRTGGDGDVYVRTGRAATKEQLAAGNGWEMWGKMQQNVQVGVVPSLDNFTDNGIYSGIYTNEGTHYETFVMVVINNYVAATATGKIRCISQFKYALNTDSNFSYKTRTGRGTTNIEWGSWVDLGAAKTSDIQDGAITAQKLAADVRTKVDNPLRPLFIAAGAEYNDTGADRTRTAPWGETVTHKAGYYYLNGLGDITEEQMVDIYNAGRLPYPTADEFYRNTKIRTNLSRDITGGDTNFYSIGLTFFYLNSIEVASINTNESLYSYVLDMRSAFRGCANLSYINGTIYNVSTATQSMLNDAFTGCKKLKVVKFRSLHLNLFLKDSPLISKNSVLFAITNAYPTTAIAITLHPDAYARLADDAEIVAALEAQPLVSLVSA